MEFIRSQKEPRQVLAIVIRNRVELAEGGHCFPVETANTLQLGIGTYPAKGGVKAHRHPPQERRIQDTQEFILIQRGKTRLTVYDADMKPAQTVEMAAGDAVLLIAGGHAFDMLEKTTLVEIKQGPYNQKTDKVLF